MNFFKQSSDQAREAFVTMPMQSRVISVMLVAAIAIGLAILSKYQGAFIGIGALLYVLAYDRRWLRQPVLYASMALAAFSRSMKTATPSGAKARRTSASVPW